MSAKLDPIKVKVAELEARGLETKGNNKAVLLVLVERLRQPGQQTKNIQKERDHIKQREESKEDPDSAHKYKPELEFEHEAEHYKPALVLEPGNLDAESEPEPKPEAELENHSEPELRAKPTSPPEEGEPSQKGMSSFTSISHRQHSRDNTTVKDEDITVKEEDKDFTVKDEDDFTVKKEGEDITVKEEVEEEYNKMGHEDASMQNISGNKREPDTNREGPPPTAFSAKEFAEPEREPFEKRRGEKRQASSQRGPPDSKRCRPESADKHTDDDPNYDEEAVILDWYNRDLSLIIDKETFLSAKPMTSEDFAYAWHGVRASYGFLRGRLFYEVKVEDHLAVPHLEGEQHPHVVRCGWSIDDVGMMLGEEPFSYGYDGTAKASTDMKLKDYGQPFGKGDVIGCFLDMDSNPVTMSFSVNGRNFGKCYEVSHRSLQGKALFPHILTKNCTFKVNFGSEHPSLRLKSRYRFVGQIPLEERVLGSQGPQTRQNSEIPPRRPPSPKASGKEPKRQKVTTLRKKVARQDYEVSEVGPDGPQPNRAG